MIQKIEIKDIKKFFISHKRAKDSSKYDFGHVLVIGGSVGMMGACVLAADAAMKTGAGLATVCVPEGLIVPAMNHFVEEMTLAVPSESKYYFDLKSFDFLKEYLTVKKDKKISVVAIGPGLGRQKETIEFVQKIIELFLIELEIPMVIDADALYAISNTENIKNFEMPVFQKFRDKQKNVIVTPHEKEMQRLINATDIEFVKNNREYCCSELAKKNGIICVLKGKDSVVSDGRDVFLNTTGNAGMATAGAGDVLTGILAGLKGQYADLKMLDIAKISVFLHGLAGDIGSKNVGENCLIASDIINFLPEAFNQLKMKSNCHCEELSRRGNLYKR